MTFDFATCNVEQLWSDQLDQAVLVASAHAVDWKKIEAWAKNEAAHGAQAYAELRRRAARLRRG